MGRLLVGANPKIALVATAIASAIMAEGMTFDEQNYIASILALVAQNIEVVNAQLQVNADLGLKIQGELDNDPNAGYYGTATGAEIAKKIQELCETIRKEAEKGGVGQTASKTTTEETGNQDNKTSDYGAYFEEYLNNYNADYSGFNAYCNCKSKGDGKGKKEGSKKDKNTSKEFKEIYEKISNLQEINSCLCNQINILNERLSNMENK